MKDWLSRNRETKLIGIDIKERFFPSKNKGALSLSREPLIATIEAWGSGTVDFTIMAGTAAGPVVEYFTFAEENEFRKILDVCFERLRSNNV